MINLRILIALALTFPKGFGLTIMGNDLTIDGNGSETIDGATVYPNKIDIKWEEKIYLKNFF